ncbi:MAG: helix-turn-helix domain-containing protein, partial [Rhodocyclaceae bacterium]|nr:helix-turn-helix domain-containing protein [Rhodocyclaceae bacterium]
KPIRRAALIESIQGALEEARRMSQRALSSREAESRWASLTLRERQTALLALKGLSNKEIGKRMNISHRTVEIHRARVLEKTAASSILDLARLATEAGFAPPPDEE